MGVVLIIGAGFGGLSTALRLWQHQQKAREKGSCEFRVVVVDSQESFTIGGLWQFVWNDRMSLADVLFPLDQVQFFKTKDNTHEPPMELRVNTAVEAWHPHDGKVVLSDGSTLAYEKIVLACGAVPDPERLPPGMEQHLNYCSFETIERQRTELVSFLSKARALRDAVGNSSGENQKVTFVLAIGQVPYKCPVSPFEETCLVHDEAQRANLVDWCRFVIVCPVAWPMPEASKAVFLETLSQRGIEYYGNCTIDRIENRGDDTSSVLHCQHSTNDDPTVVPTPMTIQAEMIWGAYPLTAPSTFRKALSSSNLTDGLVDVDPMVHTLAGLPNVYAIGDCCRVVLNDYNNPGKIMTIPKAGEFAWKMGQSVADHIAQVESICSDRTGRCLAEVGQGKGIIVANDFSHILVGKGAHVCQLQECSDGEKVKIDWANGYLTQLFDPALMLTMDKVRHRSQELK